MNHRQWKKNFKKKHGRNPYWFEDKKSVRRTQARAFGRALGSAINIIQEQFVPALSKAITGLSQVFVEAGRAAALALRMPEPIAIEKPDLKPNLKPDLNGGILQTENLTAGKMDIDWKDFVKYNTLTLGRPMPNAICRLVEEDQEEKDGV